MKSLKGLASIIVLSLVWPATATPQDPAPEKKESGKKELTSLHKSLLIPGWGQAAEKRYLEGAVFFGSELALVYEIFRISHRSNGYYASYKAATTTEDVLKYRDLTIKNDKKRNQMMLAAAGVWAVNLIHIYLVVKHKETQKAKWDVRLNVKDAKEVSICIHYTY